MTDRPLGSGCRSWSSAPTSCSQASESSSFACPIPVLTPILRNAGWWQHDPLGANVRRSTPRTHSTYSRRDDRGHRELRWTAWQQQLDEAPGDSRRSDLDARPRRLASPLLAQGCLITALAGCGDGGELCPVDVGLAKKTLVRSQPAATFDLEVHPVREESVSDGHTGRSVSGRHNGIISGSESPPLPRRPASRSPKRSSGGSHTDSSRARARALRPCPGLRSRSGGRSTSGPRQPAALPVNRCYISKTAVDTSANTRPLHGRRNKQRGIIRPWRQRYSPLRSSSNE